MNLEFFIKLKEMVSGGLVKMADTARKTTAAIKGTNGTLIQSYDEIKRKISDLESVISKSTSVKQIREARSELEKLQKLSTKHLGNTSSSGGMLSGAIRSMLPAMTIAGALALGGSMLSSGLQAQSRQASFEVLAGKQPGTALNKDLTRYAQDSIYGNEVYDNAQTMLGFGLTVKEIMPDLKMLGDVAMGNKDRLGSLTLAFSQVRAAGKLTGQDLLQFVNAGFNPLQQMSKDTGISLGVLREKMSEGAISFAMVETAFKNATGKGGMFYDMTNKIAQTDFGKLQAFQGQLEGIAMRIGGLLAPALGFLIDNALVPLINALSSTVDWIQKNSEWLTPLAIVVGTVTGAYWLFTVAITAGTLATTLMSGAMAVLNFVMSMNPIGIVIALIAGLVAGIIYAWNKFEGFRQVVWGLWESFKTVFENIGSFFKKIFAPIFEAITAFKEGRYLDAAKAVGTMAFNLTPVGLAANAISFAKEGGFTKGLGDAWAKGKERGANKDTSVGAAGAATPTAATVSGAYGGLKKGEGDEAAKGITGGGPRVININGVKFADKIEVHSTSAQGGIDQIEKMLEEMFLRVLNSGAAVQ